MPSTTAPAPAAELSPAELAQLADEAKRKYFDNAPDAPAKPPTARALYKSRARSNRIAAQFEPLFYKRNITNGLRGGQDFEALFVSVRDATLPAAELNARIDDLHREIEKQPKQFGSLAPLDPRAIAIFTKTLLDSKIKRDEQNVRAALALWLCRVIELAVSRRIAPNDPKHRLLTICTAAATGILQHYPQDSKFPANLDGHLLTLEQENDADALRQVERARRALDFSHNGLRLKSLVSAPQFAEATIKGVTLFRAAMLLNKGRSDDPDDCATARKTAKGWHDKRGEPLPEEVGTVSDDDRKYLYEPSALVKFLVKINVVSERDKAPFLKALRKCRVNGIKKTSAP